MLNPTVISQLSSPPLSPQHEQVDYYHNNNKRLSTSSASSNGSNGSNNNGKPRSRFSNVEDAIICEGVARGLTWGQISGQLPHRKRATCFNRYRTLQGIRKSRKRSMPDMRSPPITPPNSWLPSPTKEARHHHRHSYHYHSNPVLVAPLPTRLPLPFSYADRIH
ncbi:uncharacterized protein EV154DRAFT_493138 [Mucor mucedo]|nr:uncharacterized protein EV154DRAFT_493138 [Mucor mucedo]KAI7895998.1 hypothetical protein EV154DRAFT_493138 [Mucor mucedo]